MPNHYCRFKKVASMVLPPNVQVITITIKKNKQSLNHARYFSTDHFFIYLYNYHYHILQIFTVSKL